jgi:hypothetical protein
MPEGTTPAAPADGGETPVEQLERLGVKGILGQLARDGQIVDVRCEMPQCYCFRGREYFEPREPYSDWELTADHYPRLKMHGGHLTPDNVRLAHRLCNARDYRWRKKMAGSALLEEQAASELRQCEAPVDPGRAHGGTRLRWSALRMNGLRDRSPGGRSRPAAAPARRHEDAITAQGFEFSARFCTARRV